RATLAPSLTSSRPMALPMPRLPPVMMATLPLSSRSMGCSLSAANVGCAAVSELGPADVNARAGEADPPGSDAVGRLVGGRDGLALGAEPAFAARLLHPAALVVG